MLVVGFIGRLPSRTPKKQLLKVLFEAEPLENDFFKSNDMSISVSRDRERDIIFLELDSPDEFGILSAGLEELEGKTETDIHEMVSSGESTFMRGMLFLFSACHHIMIFHPASKFNTDLLRCFRILQSVHPVLYRKCKKAAQKALDGSDIDGISLCRSPALTFVIPEPNYANLTKTDPLDWEEAKKFRGQLEVQISSLIQTEVTDTQGGGSDSRGNRNKKAFYLHPTRSLILISDVWYSQRLLSEFYAEPNGLQLAVDSFMAEVKYVRDKLFRNIDALLKYLKKDERKLPRYSQWERAARAIAECVKIASQEGPLSLTSYLDPDGYFSTIKCEQSLSVARKEYSMNLPTMYNSSVHQKHMQNAFNMFRARAYGPKVPIFEEKLEKEFEVIWEGRELCDAMSVTGRPCVHKVHSVSETAPQKRTPAMWSKESRVRPRDPAGLPHFSGFEALHACSCGAVQTRREDPFNDHEANVEFYDAQACCGLNSKARVPVPHPDWSCVYLGGASGYDKIKGLVQEGFTTNGMIPWDVPMHMRSLREKVREMEACVKEGTGDVNAATKKIACLQKFFVAQSEASAKRQKSAKKSKRGKSKPNPSLFSAQIRCFVGVEYECPIGHRNLASLSVLDKGTSLERSRRKIHVGSTFPAHDAPVRRPCNRCEHFSQMQRIFLTTPDAPVYISMEPTIKCFKPETLYKMGRKLLPSNSFFVIRFPYVYVHGAEKEAVSLSKCRLVKGSIRLAQELNIDGFCAQKESDVVEEDTEEATSPKEFPQVEKNILNVPLFENINKNGDVESSSEKGDVDSSSEKGDAESPSDKGDVDSSSEKGDVESPSDTE